jgi:NAD dependent epimerase/dehydratase family enzyme
MAMSETKKIVVTGSSGLIGSALLSVLISPGQSVTRLVRSQSQDDNTIEWRPEADSLNYSALEGYDAGYPSGW